MWSWEAFDIWTAGPTMTDINTVAVHTEQDLCSLLWCFNRAVCASEPMLSCKKPEDKCSTNCFPHSPWKNSWNCHFTGCRGIWRITQEFINFWNEHQSRSQPNHSWFVLHQEEASGWIPHFYRTKGIQLILLTNIPFNAALKAHNTLS